MPGWKQEAEEEVWALTVRPPALPPFDSLGQWLLLDAKAGDVDFVPEKLSGYSRKTFRFCHFGGWEVASNKLNLLKGMNPFLQQLDKTGT